MTIHRLVAPSIAAVSAVVILAATPASAQVPSASNEPSASARWSAAAVDPARFVPGAIVAEAGAPLATSAGWGGYDGATRTPLVGATAEVRLGSRIIIGAGATYAARNTEEPASVRPSVLARGQILDQASHGIDLGVAVAYRQDRFVTEDGLFQGTVSAGLHGDVNAVLASIGYGQDGEGDDHMGEARLIALHRLAGALHVALDGHAQWLLDSTDPHRVQHATPSLEVTIAPAITYSVGPTVVMLEIGWSGVDVDRFHSGVLALGGVGTYF